MFFSQQRLLHVERVYYSSLYGDIGIKVWAVKIIFLQDNWAANIFKI